MAFKIREAKKTQLAVKVLCSGSSGSGKSYTALRLATGIVAKEGGKIVMINTEGNRGELYADDFTYDIIDLEEPFTPESYIEAIQYAISQGATVVIIDSLSHEWTYLNELVNNMPGTSFQNWGKVKPRHRKLTDYIAGVGTHIIATGRGKDEYVMELNDKGKQTPKKVGVGVQQEKDTEYEYMVTFNIIQDTHVANVMKDNTHIFEGRYDILTEKDGEALYVWAHSGVKSDKPNIAEIQPLQQKVIALAKELGGSKDTVVKSTVESNIECQKPTDCVDATKLNKAITALEKLKQERGI